MKKTHTIIALLAIVLPLSGVALIVGATVRAQFSYPIWYSTNPSVVTVDQKLGTMGAIYKGTADVCEQFSAEKKQCYGVTVK